MDKVDAQIKSNISKLSAQSKKLTKAFKVLRSQRIKHGNARTYSQASRRNLKKLNSNNLATLLKSTYKEKADNSEVRRIFKDR